MPLHSRVRRFLTQRDAQLSQAQKALQRSEERLRLAMGSAQLGTWHWNVRTGEVVWSELTYAIFGLPPSTPMTSERVYSLVHPDDLARVQESLSRAIEGHTDYDVELRCVWSDGSVHWLSARGRATYDARGEVVSVEGVCQDVTAKKEAAEQLRQSAARFEHLAEAMPHLVWQVSPDGQLLYVNERFRQYVGLVRLEEGWLEFVHPDDRQRTLTLLSELAQNGGAELVNEGRVRRSDGTYRWFMTRAVPVRDSAGKLVHVVGSSTDIDDLKAAEAALRESQQRLELAITAANIGLWDWHLATGRVYASREWKRQLGYEDHEISNDAQEWTSRIHPDDAERTEAYLRSYLENPRGPYSQEFRLRHKDGSYRAILSHGMALLDEQGRLERLIGCHVDLTEIKRLEEELRQAQKMEAVGKLAGGVAHDFNNLLTVILGHASLVQARRELPADVAEAVRGISLAAERAASLTAQLLAFGRRQVMQSHVLDLGALVADVTQMLRRVLGADVQLTYEPAEVPLPVQGDPGMLTQVLLNLAVNARDAMPQGGKLLVRTSLQSLDTRISQSAPSAERSWACLTVADTGTGISANMLPHIFEPFVTSKEVGKGTGLGLSTVYGLVRQHGGYVTVDTEPGAGSTFRVYLPLSSKPAPELTELRSDGSPRGRGELVLLVEDDDPVRALLSDILGQHGYRVVQARTGGEAIRTFRERGGEVDLVLTDVVMPGGLTGMEVLESLRATRPALKAILSSGYSPELVGERKSCPQVTFLQKPFTAAQLLGCIRRVLDQG